MPIPSAVPFFNIQWDDILFMTFAGIMLGSGLLVVTMKDIIRCGLAMIVCFGALAGIYVIAGAPLVAAASGGLAEILGDTEAALLFEPGWADACADAVLRTLTEPRLAERCQQAGHALVAEGYAWDLVAAQTVQTYEQVMTADA